jgi:hypothetical protein
VLPRHPCGGVGSPAGAVGRASGVRFAIVKTSCMREPALRNIFDERDLPDVLPSLRKVREAVSNQPQTQMSMFPKGCASTTRRRAEEGCESGGRRLGEKP